MNNEYKELESLSIDFEEPMSALQPVSDQDKVQSVLGKTRGKGRPPKSEMTLVKNKNKNKVGRPAGDAARLNEFKARLLATGGSRILDKMIKIALDDNHPGQMAAIKMSIDRIMPMSMFESAKNGGSTPQITINVSGINSSSIDVKQDETTEEVQYTDYKEED